MFRRGIDRNVPAVRLPQLVLTRAEIPHHQIGLHLQLRDRTFEVLFAALAEAGLLPQLEGKKLVFPQRVHDLLFTLCGKPLVPAGVKIVAVAAGIGKIDSIKKLII